MLYIFDKDGTLISGMGTRPANTPAEQKPMPGVVKQLSYLRSRGDKIAIASNQGGVAWGFITYEQAQELMDDCARKIGGADYVTFCPYDPKAYEHHPGVYAIDHPKRKPNPGMILECMKVLGFSKRETVYIGDQETDNQAAKAAGVKFEWATDFFIL